MTTYQLPRGISKNDLKKDVANWEQRTFKEPKHTLSQAVADKRLIQVWDLSELSPLELAVIYEKFTHSQSDCLMLIHLKK
jgi:hypothetical protein